MIYLSKCEAKPGIGGRVHTLHDHMCLVTDLHDGVAINRNDEIFGN